ncbi:HEAT repeat domain-containing protein [Methanoculleus sp.]|uniref:HEAT repeat domain-containing protein n=1 Tax=Methanoculleus sp. TaxID=90427 RepID=UPI001BD32A89|nr:HEAT repeat domain-containing protein [Methanoculleus sp.]
MNPAGLPGDSREWGRLAIIALATLLAVLLDLLFNTVTYTHFFYLVLILAAFWYRRSAVAVGVLLAGVHIAVEYLLYGPPGPGIFVSAGVFVAAAYLLGYLFELAGRRGGGLHFRTGESGAPACDRDTGRLIARLSSRDPETRYQAAGCLGDAGVPGAVEPLAALLADPEVGVRWKATEALGKLGSPAVGPLAGGLRSDDVDVRWMAAVALGEIGDPAAIPALMGALNDEDAYVRSRAALALGAIGEVAREGLVANLSTGNERVRWGAALALGSIGGESAIAALIGALRDPDGDVRQQACGALGDIGEPALPSLIEALRTDDEALRQGAIAALDLVGRPAVAPLALALGTGDDWRVRRGAARALGEIGERRATDALIRALDDEREEVREAAREALGSIRKT